MKSPRRKRLPGQLAAINTNRAYVFADNALRAWALKAEGKTTSEIADALGVSVVSANKYLRCGMEAARDHYTSAAMDHIQIILSQLESIISKWRKLADCPAAEGADRAAAIVLRALEQKAKLLGLEGKAGGLVMDGGEQVMDLTEALKSQATREALRRMLDEADRAAATERM